MSLQDEAFDAILAMVNSTSIPKKGYVVVDGRRYQFARWQTGQNEEWYGRPDIPEWVQSLSDWGATYGLATNKGFVKLYTQLSLLIQQGDITTRQASSYIQKHYQLEQLPDSGFWKLDEPTSKSDAATAHLAMDAVLSADAGKSIIESIPQDVALGSGSVAGDPSTVGAATIPGISVPSIPSNAKAAQIQEALEQVASQANAALASLRGGNINFGTGSIPGSALIPGTVQASRLSREAVSTVQRLIPRVDEAVELRIAPDPSLDRWADSGPGRVWRVQRVSYPAGYRRVAGPVRYRIKADPLRLSVCSYGLTNAVSGFSIVPSSSASGNPVLNWECVYGLIIRGLPVLNGVRPTQILSLTTSGDVESSLTVDPTVGGWVSGSAFLADPRAISKYVTTPPVAYAEFYDPALAVSGAQYLRPTYATPNYPDQIQGLVAHLIRSDAAAGVFAELCGRPCPGTLSLGGAPMGVGVSAPPGYLAPAILRPALATITSGQQLVCHSLPGTGGAAEWTSANAADGGPLDWDDCAALRQTDQSFTVSLQAYPPRIVREANALGAWYYTQPARPTTPDMNPSNWPTSGLEIRSEGFRHLEFDLVVA